MPDWIKYPLVLIVVALISASALAGLERLTEPTKLRIQTEITERALKVVMPKAETFEEKEGMADGEEFSYRLANDGEGNLVGYVAEGAAEGYSSLIKVMVGLSPELTIDAIKVLYQQETPGLGDKVDEILSKRTWWTVITGTSPDETGLRPWFQIQFDGKQVPLRVKKDGGDIEAITGATISSRAVCDAVNNAVDQLKLALKPEPTEEEKVQPETSP